MKDNKKVCSIDLSLILFFVLFIKTVKVLNELNNLGKPKQKCQTDPYGRNFDFQITITKKTKSQKLHTFELNQTEVDPTKLFFFANEEFLCFLLVSLRFCCIQKKFLDSKMT